MPYESYIESHASLFYLPQEGQALPSVGDGKTYSRALGWQSPEGNFFGQERWVRDWPVGVVWNGREYQSLEFDGEATSPSMLPMPGQLNVATGQEYAPRRDFEVWATPRENWPPTDLAVYDGRDKDFYYWDVDTESWNLIKWYYTVDGDDELPNPGLHRGSAHIVMYEDVKVYWTGLAWKRLSHDMIDVGEHDTLHLPEGFIDYLVPDVELVFSSRKQLSLIPKTGGLGYVLINGEKVHAAPACSVFSALPALRMEGKSVVPQHILPNTEYYIYLANTKSDAFSVEALPANEVSNATRAWNFNGRLFLSPTEPTDGYFGGGVGKNAIVAGQINTDNTSKEDGGPYFRHELDISWISKRPKFTETWRNYSDYYLEYVGPDELRLTQEDGTYGMLYVPEELICFGAGQSILRSDPWLYVDPDSYEPGYRTDALDPNNRYFAYIINDIDALNFNDINEITNRPWTQKDDKADLYYKTEKDFRRKLVLSNKEHEHYRLAETSPLFFTRCVGYIDTDDNGRFIYSKDGSYIKALQINPVHLKGLSDIVIYPVSKYSFKVAAKSATAGIVYVGGHDVKAYSINSPSVHQPSVDDIVKVYTESNITSPLSDSNQVKDHADATFYIYLCNYDACWGELAGRTIWCLAPPDDGYLSHNYPGTGARWVATIRTDASGQLTGSWLSDSIGDMTPVLGTLPDLVNQVSENVDQIEFLMGWTSNYDLGLDPYVSALYSNYSDLSNDLSNLWGNYSDISYIADSLDSNVSLMYSVLSDAYSEISAIQSEIGVLDSLNQSLGSELGYMDSNLSNMDIVISNMASDISGIGDDVSLLSNVTSNIDKELSYMDSNLSDLRAINSGLDSDVSQLYTDISALEATRDSLSASVSLMGIDISGIISAQSNVFSNLSELGSDVEGLKSLQSMFDSNVWDLLSDASLINDLNSQMTSTLSVITVLNSDLSQIQSNLDATESRLLSDQSYISEVYALMSANLNDIIQDHQILMNLHWWLDVNESALREDYSVMSALQVSMSANIQDLYSDASALSHITDLIWSDNSSISGWVTSLSNLHWSLSGAVSGLGSYLGNLSEEVGYLTSNIDSLASTTSGDFTNVYSNLSAMSDDLSHMWGSYSAISDYVDDVSLIASGLINDASNLSGHVTSLSNQVSYLNQDISEASQYANSLSNQLSLMSGHLNTQSLILGSLSAADSRLASDLSQQVLYANSLSGLISNQAVNLSLQSQYINSLSNTQVSLSSNITRLSGIQISLSAAVTELDSDIIITSNLVNSLASYTSSISGKVSLTSANMNILSQNVVNLNSNYNTTSGLVNTLSGNISTISGTVNQTSLKVVSLSNTTSLLTSNVNKLSGYVGSLSIITSDLNVRTSNLSGNLVSASQLTNSLYSNYSAMSGIQTSMQSSIGILDSRASNLSGDLNNLTSLTNNIDSLTERLYSEASEMSGNLVTTGSHLSQLSGNINNLDSYVSSIESGLVSGYVGTIPRLITYDWIGKRFKFEDQKGVGVPVRVSYTNATTVTITPLETNTQIVFANASIFNLSSSATISLSSCPNSNTLYYLYLKCAAMGISVDISGSVSSQYYYFSPEPPTGIFTSMATRSSTGGDLHDSILIGYVSVSSANTMSGDWNVWSLIGQPDLTWSVSFGPEGTSGWLSGLVKPYYLNTSTSAVITVESNVNFRGGIHLLWLSSYCSYPPYGCNAYAYTPYVSVLGASEFSKNAQGIRVYYQASHYFYAEFTSSSVCGTSYSGQPIAGTIDITLPSISWDASSSVLPGFTFVPQTTLSCKTPNFAAVNSYYYYENVTPVAEGSGTIQVTRVAPSNAIIVR